MNRSRFDSFWRLYPRKQGKKSAHAAFDRLKPNRGLLDLMLAAITRQIACDQWRRGIIPLPATWLNQARWEDETTDDGNQAAVDAWVAKGGDE